MRGDRWNGCRYCSGRVAWMGFIMFLLHVLVRILRYAANSTNAAALDALYDELTKLVFVSRHIAGTQVETHFFYFSKLLVDKKASLSRDAYELFKSLICRGGESRVPVCVCCCGVVVLCVMVIWCSLAEPSTKSWLICHHVVHGIVNADNAEEFLSATLVLCSNAKHLCSDITRAEWKKAIDSVKSKKDTTGITSSSKGAACSGKTKLSGHSLSATFGGSWSLLFHGVIADDPEQCREPVGAPLRLRVVSSALCGPSLCVCLTGVLTAVSLLRCRILACGQEGAVSQASLW